jgi:hypothetical protein
MVIKFRIILLFILSQIIYSCQDLNEINPPDFEEKLCVSAIINNKTYEDRIIVEKSYQGEYLSEAKEPLENLTLKISSDEEIIFEYHNPYSENRIDTIFLPDNINFHPGAKYTLSVSEKNTKSVTSEIIVPDYPQSPDILFQGFTETTLTSPLECNNPVKSASFSINFRSKSNQYYYISIDGYTKLYYNDSLKYCIDYDVLESNSPFFKTEVPIFRSLGFRTCGLGLPIYSFNVYKPCFFCGLAIPNSICNLTLKINLSKESFDFNKPIRITLNAISSDLYDFEKNYKTYLESYIDPFSEPVYLKGNIKDGSGIFAINSSKHFSIIIPK